MINNHLSYMGLGRARDWVRQERSVRRYPPRVGHDHAGERGVRV